MKKLTNTVRIEMVPRTDLPPKTNGEFFSSDNHPQLHATKTHGTSDIDPLHGHQQTHHIVSPNHVRVHDASEISSNKVQPQNNNLNHYQPLPPTRPRQETVSELYEVPSKPKMSMTKKVVLGLIAATIIAAIIAGVVVAVVLTRPKDTAAAATSSTTTVAPLIISAVWSFDNVTNDLYGIYNGSLVNSPTYSNATSQTLPYFGSGQALLFSGTNQAFAVSSPVFPLNSTSFTIEGWIHPTVITNDRGIFGQCQCTTCANQCLYFILRSSRLFVDFTLNDLSGATTLAINTWYHVAFVYNYQTRQQILYLNGVQDGIKSSAAPYQGINGTTQIGATQAFGVPNYFTGLIDNMWVTTRAKSADEILRDASLIVYFSFDLLNPNADNGPNTLMGTPFNTITLTGRVNQAMRFTGSGSYFQMFGLAQVPTSLTNNRPFSVSLWINPSSSGISAFVQLFSTLAPLRCTNLLGIISGGGSNGQIYVNSVLGGIPTLTGPFVSQNVWTHISVTYGLLNGFTLYFNGISFGATGNLTYQSGPILATLYIGYSGACSGGAVNGAYQGSIDEVYVHNRELTQADVTSLANP